MVQDRDGDNPYQSPCVDDAALEPSHRYRQTRAVDLAIVGGARGSVIGAMVGAGIAVLLGSVSVIWTGGVEAGDSSEFRGIEAVLVEIVAFAIFGAILGTASGLLIGIALGFVAGRTVVRCHRGLRIFAVSVSVASGIAWSTLLGLTAWDEAHAWHPVLSILATSIVIAAAAFGGAWRAAIIADAAWGHGELDSLPKAETKS